MKKRTDKTQEPQKEIVQRVQQEPSTGGEAIIADNRPTKAIQRKLRSAMGNAEDTTNPIQRKNNTGLPDTLKSGIENLSGYSMDDVKVHYNSSKPAQLQAHAYAQGTDIHLAPGQQKHLPHEAWHVVQQKQGRVKPTRQLKSKVNINDDAGLEKEADVMGKKALGFSFNRTAESEPLKTEGLSSDQAIQRYEIKNEGLTVAGEFHSKSEEQRKLEAEFVKSVKGASAQVWTENKMPGSKTDAYEASEIPEHLLLSGIDRIKYYSTILMAQLSKDNPLVLSASNMAISTSIKALKDAHGTISNDLSNALFKRKIDVENDPHIVLQTLKHDDFFMTIITSDTKEIDEKEKSTLLKNYKNFLSDLENFDKSISTIITIPNGRNISHNFIRSKRMNDIANEKKDVNGVWLIGQYHAQEIQEHLRHNIQYELVSMKDFNDSIRKYVGNEGELVGNLSNEVGEVSASARIIKSSLKFFNYLNNHDNHFKSEQLEEKINFEVQRLIEHSRILNRINRKDLVAINLSMNKEEKSKTINDIMLMIRVLKEELANVPLLTFINEFSPGKKRPEFISLILKSLSRKNLHELVSDLEKLASVAK
ncbi:eCIS core domain-containing protein [Aquimarina algiphila]|uniref:eCIS core domain-containing protein n=1 Tax=Aquimarina algiphila TaxID=2047982 RepID=UPI0023305B32|nr:DUF4157 domain-containing protein [Aquimarina algiphila]